MKTSNANATYGWYVAVISMCTSQTSGQQRPITIQDENITHNGIMHSVADFRASICGKFNILYFCLKKKKHAYIHKAAELFYYVYFYQKIIIMRSQNFIWMNKVYFFNYSISINIFQRIKDVYFYYIQCRIFQKSLYKFIEKHFIC